MKITSGNWLLLPSVQAIYPVSVVDVQIEPDALVVTGYSHEVRNRNDLIDGSIITARFSSPMPDVLRVQLAHFKGRHEHRHVFDLDYSQANPATSLGQDERHVWLKTGQLSVYIPA